MNLWADLTVNTSKQQKMAVFSEYSLSGDDSEAALATFFCHVYDANTSHAVQKIATDEKGHHKCPLFRFSLLHSHNILLTTVKKIGF